MMLAHALRPQNPSMVPRLPDSHPRCQVGSLTNIRTGEHLVVRCKRWACADCGPRRVRRWRARINRNTNWSYFVTLTMAGDGSVSRENLARQAAAWRNFSRWLKRRAELQNYTWVREAGSRNGRLHLHALIQSDRLSYKAAREALVRDGFGAVCNFQRVRHRNRVANYISKYLAKGLAAGIWPRGARRCQTTIAEQKHELGPDWWFEFLHRRKVTPADEARVERWAAWLAQQCSRGPEFALTEEMGLDLTLTKKRETAPAPDG